MNLALDFNFDDDTYRHYMNGFLTVLHCHHYLCLTTRTAIQFKDLGGIEILKSSVIDTIGPIIKEYINKNNIHSFEEKISVGAKYYSVMGLGKMKVKLVDSGAQVELMRSHIDQGWLKKWGKTNVCINFFTIGYIQAMFAAATDSPYQNFNVREIASIVSGKEASIFIVENK
ncbi:MAG: hypothetical protein KJP07_20345 [Desulfatitalea sp.]|nr:hypothetical protein [Desulfatitalea sp.]